MKAKQLNVARRDIVGTGKLKALRAKGIIPAVVYGTPEGNINIQIHEPDMRVLLGRDETDSLLVELSLEGQKILSIIKDIQHNHLTDNTTHVDFQAVEKGSVVLVKVPVHLKGTPVGVAMGGQVQQMVYDLPVKCAVENIPDAIEADVTPLSLGESLRLAQISLPEGTTTPFNGTVVLASVVKP